MNRAFSRVLCRVGASVVAVGGAAFAAPSLAAARTPADCGKILYHSITFDKDLNCSSTQDGLIVGAPNITIDLNGFAINGHSGPIGIDNAKKGGMNGVTVKNGDINHFTDGVDYDYAAKGKVTHVSLTNNTYGVDFSNSRGGVIRGSSAAYNQNAGFFFYNDRSVSLINSKAKYNGGVGIEDAHSLDLLRGDVSQNNDGYGFYVQQPLTASTSSGRVYSTVMNSTANANGYEGFIVVGNSPTTLYQAKLTGNHSDYNALWGYWASQMTKGNNNFAVGNGSGNCFQVQCSVGP